MTTVAVAHFDTGRPHLHIILRGVRGNERDLVFSRGYAAHGLRGRCETLATEILGPRTDRTASICDLTADRLTAWTTRFCDGRTMDGSTLRVWTAENAPTHSAALSILSVADGLPETAKAVGLFLKICAISCEVSANRRRVKPPQRAPYRAASGAGIRIALTR